MLKKMLVKNQFTKILKKIHAKFYEKKSKKWLTAKSKFANKTNFIQNKEK